MGRPWSGERYTRQSASSRAAATSTAPAPAGSSFMDSAAPEDYLDPITMVLMEEPVTIPETGRTYELSSIQEWFERGNWTCPLTNVRLKELVAVSNPVLKDKIENWKRRQRSRSALPEETGSRFSINGWTTGHEDALESKRTYYFKGTIHPGLPTEAEMIQHQEEVLMATHRLRELIGARRAVKLLRLIWDPEQGWSTADQVSASECYIAGPNVIFGDSGCTTLSMLLQPRPNPDGTIVFNEAVMSIALLWLKIGAHGAAALTRALKGHLSRDGCTWLYNQHLTTLRLARNRLEDEGAREIAEIFSPRRSDGDWVYCTAIEHLDLSFNNVGDAGARALAQAFGPRENGDGKWVWPPLTKLNMYGNPRIGDQAIAALVDSLLSPRENEDGSWAFNTNLKHLCIDGTNMGSCTVETVLKVLETKHDSYGRPEVNMWLQLLELAGSETESSLVQLVLSSVAKVLDRNSHWHSLQAARRQLQNQRFLQKKFHARWITVKL